MTYTDFTVSEIQIKYTPKVKPIDRPKITTSKDAFNVLMPFFNIDLMCIKEEAVVLFLNRGNRVIGAHKISSGGLTGTVVDPRIILAIALKSLACGLILAHTHPSGELKPSSHDLSMTSKIKEAAAFHDINLLDHLIITIDGYRSFAEDGML